MCITEIMVTTILFVDLTEIRRLQIITIQNAYAYSDIYSDTGKLGRFHLLLSNSYHDISQFKQSMLGKICPDQTCIYHNHLFALLDINI